jgi:hypothetical protein
MSKDCATPALSDAEIDEIEQRAAKATQGPWRWGCWETNFGSYEPAELTERNTLEYLPTMLQFSGGVRRAEDEPVRIVCAERGEGPEFDDRVFIACAREDVPKLIAEVRRLRAEATAAETHGAEREAWQPIETAPKEGTHIVLLGTLWNDPNQTLRACVSWYCNDRKDSPAYCLGWFFSAPGYSNGFNPTHWMRLPARFTERESK